MVAVIVDRAALGTGSGADLVVAAAVDTVTTAGAADITIRTLSLTPAAVGRVRSGVHTERTFIL